MQKVINVLAITSFALTASLAGGAGYVYLQRESIKETIRENVMNEVTKAIPAIVNGAVGDTVKNIAPPVPAVEPPTKQMEIPVSPLN